MTEARLIDGKATAKEVRREVARSARELIAGGLVPTLAVVRAGDDPASAAYVRNKERACRTTEIRSVVHELPADTTTSQLLRLVDELNADGTVHGVLVQTPLPPQVDTDAVLCRVDPAKDVDGAHPQNLGLLLAGTPRFVACTPRGILRLLREHDIPIRGAEAVIIGRSRIVGRPMAALLTAEHATVTVCHSQTRDLGAHVRRGDIVVAAVGRPELVRGSWIRPGATVIDVGINRDEESGELVGDICFEEVSRIAGAVTPVPGGVGPMTVASLLENTIDAARAFLARAGERMAAA